LTAKGASVLDLMGNQDSTRTLKPGEPVYVISPRLTPDQLFETLSK